MKQIFYSLIVVLSIIIIFTACNEENVAPEIVSYNLTDTAIHVGSELILEAEIHSDLVFNYKWYLNYEEKSNEAIYVFTPEKSGEYIIKLIVENKYGKDSIESVVTVLPEIINIDFENLQLGTNNYWNGSDGSGKFISGIASFNNFYDATYMYWEGFSYSNMNDTVTAGYMNQYSVYNSKSSGNKFSIFYPSMMNTPSIEFENNQLIRVQSIEVCNSTYTALSMKNGDSFAKKFGGETGNEKDYLKIIINGIDVSGNIISSMDFYLADFRSSDNSEDYIISEWKKVDISPLGAVNKISFIFDSSDKGDWGINTPCYFCLDNIKYLNPNDII